jgi:hypothetical protein
MLLEELINKNFDKYTDKIKSILENKTHKIDAYISKYDEKIINIYDNNDNLLLSANYETIGTYDLSTSIFFWEFAFQLFPKLELSDNIESYKKELSDAIIKRTYKDSKYMEQLYYYITNNIFYIKYENIENLLKFIIYITKYNGIVDETLSDNKNIYYLITNIITIK